MEKDRFVFYSKSAGKKPGQNKGNNWSEYVKETNKDVEKDILQIFKRICNDDIKMFNFMLSWFSYCITGETKEQKSLFTIGLKASNGKSTASKIGEVFAAEERLESNWSAVMLYLSA